MVGDPFIQSRRIDFIATPKATRVDATFLSEYFDHRGSPHLRKPIVNEQFRQRENAEAIERGSRRRGLIGMPAAARNERLVEQARFVVD